MSSKRKKICFLSFQAYSLFNPICKVPHGGSEVQLYNWANYLAQYQEWEVVFIVGDFGQPQEEFFNNVHVVKAVPLGKGTFFGFTKFYYLLKFFWLVKKINADFYIQRAAGLETGLLAFWCRLLGKKFIYMTASDIDVDGRFKKMNKLGGVFYEYGIKKASAVVAQNEKHQELLKEKYNINAHLIKNSFIFPKRIPDLSEKKFILWVGTSQPLKQPELFLEMAKRMPKEKFVMIMPKHNLQLWQKIEKEVKSLANITFIERVPFQEIDKYFAQAKLFVNTSTFEGFPNTFVQATMQAVPLASLNVNPDGFLEKYDCGFCAKGDLNKLITEVSTLLADDQRWKESCFQARKYAQDNHDIANNVARFLRVLE